MGCCGISVYPRDPNVDNAQNRMEIMKALKDLITNYDTEAKEIQGFLKNGTPMKNESLQSLDKPSLQKRPAYLGELCDCFGRVINALNKCNDNIDLKQTKDLIQPIIGNYYCAYDDSKRYKNDEKAFMNYAQGFFKK